MESTYPTFILTSSSVTLILTSPKCDRVPRIQHQLPAVDSPHVPGAGGAGGTDGDHVDEAAAGRDERERASTAAAWIGAVESCVTLWLSATDLTQDQVLEHLAELAAEWGIPSAQRP